MTPKFPEMHFVYFVVQYFGNLPLPLDVNNVYFFLKASLSLQGLTLTTVSLVNYRVFKIKVEGTHIFGGSPCIYIFQSFVIKIMNLCKI